MKNAEKEFRRMETEMSSRQYHRLTPLMGWASWNCFFTNISEECMKAQADALVKTGLAECGYTYLNMDDGFFGGRDESGRLQIRNDRFPNGIKVVADYAHSLGLKAGIYSEAGDHTCGYYYNKEGYNGEGVGLYGHEEQDLRMYFEEFGFDYIKVDWCGGVRLGLDEEEQYGRIGRIIEQLRHELGRTLVFNVCRWQFPGAWVTEVADSWRTAADIWPGFESILHQLDNIKPLRKYCGPGHVNDLDMMQIGNGLTLVEEKSHFTMWCMMSTPLIIGCDLTKIQEDTLNVLKNKELIAINQDSACLQAFVTKEYRAENEKNAEGTAFEDKKLSADVKQGLLGEVWVKDLGEVNSKRKAVAFLNRSDEELTMSATLKEMGIGGRLISARDLWKHEDLSLDASDEICVTVEPHGVKVLLVEGEYAVDAPDVFVLNGGTDIDVSVEEISKAQTGELIAKGAVLVDVRMKEEYEAEHEDGAIHIPYCDIHGVAGNHLTDKERPIILYCTTGKRSSQAGQSLKYLGYKEVYRWKRG